MRPLTIALLVLGASARQAPLATEDSGNTMGSSTNTNDVTGTTPLVGNKCTDSSPVRHPHVSTLR
jgi:hypothetical protein